MVADNSIIVIAGDHGRIEKLGSGVLEGGDSRRILPPQRR